MDFLPLVEGNPHGNVFKEAGISIRKFSCLCPLFNPECSKEGQFRDLCNIKSFPEKFAVGLVEFLDKI